jgi:hypothetical protein
MKQTRKTPLNRSAPLKRVSAKRAALMRKVGPARRAYISEIGYCAACWVLDRKFVNERLAVHEIAKGSHREKALSERAAWLVACDHCNCGRLNDYSVCPLELQLVVKLFSDPEHFDLAKVNELRGRAATAIVMSDLLKFVSLKQQPQSAA